MTDNLDFHADDFGLSEQSDYEIIDLCQKGCLDSISIMPNMAHFEVATAEFLSVRNSFPKNVLVSVHLNFMEGKCCAPREKVQNLVDENGFFTCSWGKLVVWSIFLPIRNKIRRELALEIAAQTDKALAAGLFPEDKIRFDSHQHTHMIPIVFDALMDAIKENNYKTEFIRNSQDPLIPYFLCPSLYKSFSPANIVKCLVLGFYSLHVKRILRRIGLPVFLLCGVFFSGNMSYPRLKKVLPRFAKKKRPTEILFHPGRMTEAELTEEFTKPGFNSFHLSETRNAEHDALLKLHRQND